MVRETDAAKAGALERSMSVLEAVVAAAPQVALSEIALRTGLPKPTVHRILQVFVARGYVRQEADSQYGPGLRLLSLAGQVWRELDHGTLARPAMLELQQVFPETIHMAFLDGSQLVYVEKVESRRAYRMASAIGMALPFHSTAIGKAVLAHLPEADYRTWAASAQLSRRTARTITALDQLEGELGLIRRRGYAVDNEENEDEITCVGAAVFDARGRVFGGVSASAPSFLLRPEEITRIAPHVIRAASRISLAAGLPAERLPAAYAALAVAAGGRAGGAG